MAAIAGIIGLLLALNVRYAVASGMLGDVHAFIRDAKNFFDSGAMQGKASYTKAAGDLKLTEHRITRDPDPQTLCQDLRLFQPGLRHQHNELIASVPCNHVGLADLL